ncbi:MAG: hypothetical protein RMX96_26655 [Nostoc sp. ChiSLP02]|nr:hypothetical protein [Nostoc sp. ChiSLP02]
MAQRAKTSLRQILVLGSLWVRRQRIVLAMSSGVVYTGLRGSSGITRDDAGVSPQSVMPIL